MVWSRGVKRISQSIVLGLPEMIDQQITGEGCNPGHKGAATYVVGIERTVHSDEDLLCQVLRIVGRSSKAITNVVDPTMIPLNDLVPSDRVAGNAATDQQSSQLGVFQDLLPGNRVRIGTMS